MTNDRTETIDGYHIRWLTVENRAFVREALNRGDFDGVGCNPYRGWTGNLGELFAENLGARALVLPFADRVGFVGDWLSCQKGLEMLLLSEFTGVVCIDGESLRVLRLLMRPGVKLGHLPWLRNLYLREPTLETVQSLRQSAPRLVTLQLNGGSLSSIVGIESLEKLENVELTYLKKLKSISALANGLHLHTLTVESVRGINDLVHTISHLKSLRVLRLVDCGNLEDFSFLDKLDLQEFRCSRTKVIQPNHPALARIKTVFVG